MIMVILIALLIPLVVFGQSIDNFDSEPDSGYWIHEISENADTALSYVDISYITDPVFEGAGAMQLDYSAHNSEAWGGYAKIYHMSSTASEEAPVLAGTWQMAPEAGALMVGPAPNDGSWWSNSEEDVVTRACYFDDQYVFNADGSFNNVLQDETWLETWQGGAEGCGTPVAPHDGSNAATYTYDAGTGTVTLNGVGAYLGLPKAHNEGELGSPDDAPESITYDITLSDNNNTMTLVIECGSGVFWTFKLVADEDEAPLLSGTWMMAPEAGALMVGPSPNDGSWWSNSEEDVVTRACYFDDEYVFNADGSFNNVLGDETWIEGWQSGSDACEAPVYPHDGSHAATWVYDEDAGTITLNGVGAYLGLPKAHNEGELDSLDKAPESIIYDITLSDNNSTMILVIECGSGVFWTFKLVADENEEAPLLLGTWKMAPEAGALMVGPAPNDGRVKKKTVTVVSLVDDYVQLENTSEDTITITDESWFHLNVNGVTLTTLAFDKELGVAGKILIIIAVLTFSFSTMFGYSYYGRKCAGYLLGVRWKPAYNWVYVLAIVVASMIEIDIAINFVDSMFALMAIPTVISTLILAPKVMQAARKYFRQLES